MAIEIWMTAAGIEDCILIRCGKEEKKVNLLIDSGQDATAFDPILRRILWNQEKIDLFILYNKDTVIGKLFCFFSIYFAGLSAPTAESLAFLLVVMLALESDGSIQSLYRHFLAKAIGKSRSVFYYLSAYAKVDYSGFMAVTAKIALSIISDAFRPLPVRSAWTILLSPSWALR